MLFKVPTIAPRVERKTQMSIGEILAFRDTWMERPSEGFSVPAILCSARIARIKKAEVPKLVTTENGFRVRDKENMNDSEKELRRVQSTLNKLTEQNFDTVSKEILSPELIFNPVVLDGSLRIIFNKAVAEPVFSALYARLCATIACYERDIQCDVNNMDTVVGRAYKRFESEIQDLISKGVRTMGCFVRLSLVHMCQEFHNAFIAQLPPQNEEEEKMIRQRNMANIKFVGELYLRSLATDRVILIVCGTALNLDNTHPKIRVSDVDLEMVISLLTVVGRKVDEPRMAESVAYIWEELEGCVIDKSFSARIRFLLQNLLEWRKTGWRPKDKTVLTSSSANTDAPTNVGATAYNGPSRPTKAPPQSQHGQHYSSGGAAGSRQPPHMPRAMSTPQADAFGYQSAHRRPQERVTSHTDLSHLGGHSASQQAFHPGGLSAVSGPPVQEITEEDKKMISLALPPLCFSEEAIKDVLSIVRDATVDGDWAAADEAILKIVPEPPHVCRMCAVYALVRTVTESPREEDRLMFTKALSQGLFDSSTLSRGFSWCLTNAIANTVKEDFPRVFIRFSEAVVETPSIGFACLVRDVMMRTANYLDALCLSMDGDGVQWEADFIDVWVDLLKTWGRKRGDVEVDAREVLDALAGVKQRPFMGDIVPDFLVELVQKEFITAEATALWREENADNEKGKTLMEQLNQLYPTA